MWERVYAIGGIVEVVSTADTGTIIKSEIPI